jgi:hypothetical protein
VGDKWKIVHRGFLHRARHEKLGSHVLENGPLHFILGITKQLGETSVGLTTLVSSVNSKFCVNL